MVQTKEEYNEYMRTYMRTYMLNRYHRRRDEAIDQLGGACVDCGTTENLEFDHANAVNKEYDIGKIFTSGSESILQAEISKCVLRCKTCHLEKSRREDWHIVEHGGGVSGKKNCPCEPCKTKKAEYMRNYKR